MNGVHWKNDGGIQDLEIKSIVEIHDMIGTFEEISLSDKKGNLPDRYKNFDTILIGSLSRKVVELQGSNDPLKMNVTSFLTINLLHIGSAVLIAKTTLNRLQS